MVKLDNLNGGFCAVPSLRVAGEHNQPDRLFLGWEQTPVLAWSRAIWDRFGLASAGRLGHLLVVVPTRRAGRLLLASLIELAASKGAALGPPRIVTPADATDLMLGRTMLAPGPVVTRLAWTAALRAQPEDVLRAIVQSVPPASVPSAWARLAQLIARAHDELSAEGLVFADVVRRGPEVPGFMEIDRWRALENVQDEYAARLVALGKPDPGLGRIELLRVGASAWSGPVVLASVADPPRVLRLSLASHQGGALSLVCAPEADRDRFDEIGALIASRWTRRDLSLNDDAIEFAEDDADQAERAVACLAGWSSGIAPHEAVVIAADSGVARAVARRGERTPGLTLRDAATCTVGASGPGRLLARIADLLATRSADALAAFVRHPAVTVWITITLDLCPTKWLDELAVDRHERLPRLASPGVRALSGAQKLLGALWDAEPAPVGTHASSLANLLLTLYGSYSTADPAPDRCGDALAASALIEAAHELVHTGDLATVSAAEAAQLLIEEAGANPLPGEPDGDSVELIGWLEALYDPASHAVVCGANEGAIPSDPAGASGALLPDAVRRALGVRPRSSHAGIDKYRIAALVATKRSVRFIAGRRTAQGEPLLPSRFLLGAGETMVRRVRRASAEHLLHPVGLVEDRLMPDNRDAFAPVPDVSRAHELGDPPRIPVTGFARYLCSPYEFYLKHVLRLRERDDCGVELDGGGFGDLVHTALERFAYTEEDGSTAPDRVRAAMLAMLDAVAGDRFGDRPRPAVRLQLAAARARLSQLAEWHASRRADGWRRFTDPEWSTGAGGVELEFGPHTARVTGKIDRIERHAETGEFAVLDYKTGEHQKPPNATHRDREGRWFDLQLPIYRLLVRTIDAVGPDATVRMGYIMVGRSSSAVGLEEADWSDRDLDDAYAAAGGVVFGIKSGFFDDIGERPTVRGPLAMLTGEAFDAAHADVGSEGLGDRP
ncbi:MAG: PD-(D/E)XK nuclease family protein [Planctomycetota bacterium]